jgi:hypothetical protein
MTGCAKHQIMPDKEEKRTIYQLNCELNVSRLLVNAKFVQSVIRISGLTHVMKGY